jgi:outer membrane protein OmpA-like peptidoglycan-associated protein
LGKGINTPDWDAYYTIPASGEHAYFVSYEKSLGKSDIFRVKLPEAAKPKPVVLVRGKVINKLTGQPIGATITYDDLKTRQQIGVARSNPRNGMYTIVLPYEKVYGFNAQKEGYYPVSKNLDLLKTGNYQEVQHDLYLVPLKQGQSIRLNNLFFDYKQDTLKPASYPELARLIEILQSHPQMMIEISGHTDAQGSVEKNLQLSQARAHTVLKYLTSQGIEANRLQAKGYGQTKPLAKNATAKGRALNRRVEFLILKE